MSSKANKIPEYDELNTQLKKDDGSVSITLLTDGNIKIDATTKVTLTAPDTKIEGNFEVTGDTTLGTVVTSNGVDISATHTHTGSPTAPSGPVSPTGVPV
jgi:phage baseplate assembly protein gpV